MDPHLTSTEEVVDPSDDGEYDRLITEGRLSDYERDALEQLGIVRPEWSGGLG
jgi:hypothetical protein